MKARGRLSFSSLLPDWLAAPVPGVSLTVAKEARELAGPWLLAMLSALVAVAGALHNAEAPAVLGALLSAVLMIIMGAAVFGQEFGYRTLPLLLVQPVPRALLWQRKMGVLAVAVGTVLAVLLIGAALVSFDDSDRGAAPLLIIGLGGALGALLVAPWYALACRSTIAGVVFTLAMPAFAFLIAFLVSLARFGLDAQNYLEATGFRVFAGLLLIGVQCVAGPFLAWRWFRRIEGIDAGNAALHLPRWSVRRESPARPARAGSGWWRRTVGKELRLQTPSLILAGILVLVSATALKVRLAWPEVLGTIEWLEVVVLFYMFSVALLIGALACAEDRQTGTMLWHLVLPASAAKQWSAKAGVAIALSLALAVGLPWLVGTVQEAAGVSPIFAQYGGGFYAAMAVQTLFLCCVGLYTSSMAPNGLRAVLWAIPVVIIGGVIVASVLDNTSSQARLLDYLVPVGASEGVVWREPLNLTALALTGLVLAGFLGVLLTCAYGHYRRLDASAGRVLRHLGVLCAYVVLGGTVLGAGLAALRAAASMSPALPAAPAAQDSTPNGDARPVTALDKCEGNLLTIGWASREWAATHGNALPAQLAWLARDLANPSMLVCPADTGRVAARDWFTFQLTNCSYEILMPTNSIAEPQQVILRCPIHGVAVMGDGSIISDQDLAAGKRQGSMLPHNHIVRRIRLIANPASVRGSTNAPP